MSTEELIASFPNKEISYVVVICVILSLILGICAIFPSEFSNKRTQGLLASITGTMALVFVLIGGSIELGNRTKHQRAIHSWNITTYHTYLEKLPKIEEDVPDYNTNEDGSITAIAVTADESIVTYPKLTKKEPSAGSKDYISYVVVSGLESIGIPEGKEDITIHLKGTKQGRVGE